MALTVLRTTVNKGELSSEIDLSGYSIPDKLVKELAFEVAQFLREQILSYCAEGKSPVKGEGRFEKLSKGYATFKETEVGNKSPNLELFGDMLGDLDDRVTKDGFKIGIWGEQAAKADGHCNFSGKSNLPVRRFIPGEGQTFTDDINRQAEQIINDAIIGYKGVTDTALKGIESRSDLYGYLMERFPGLSRFEVKDAVLRSSELFEQLDDAGLTEYL